MKGKWYNCLSYTYNVYLHRTLFGGCFLLFTFPVSDPNVSGSIFSKCFKSQRVLKLLMNVFCVRACVGGLTRRDRTIAHMLGCGMWMI